MDDLGKFQLPKTGEAGPGGAAESDTPEMLSLDAVLGSWGRGNREGQGDGEGTPSGTPFNPLMQQLQDEGAQSVSSETAPLGFSNEPMEFERPENVLAGAAAQTAQPDVEEPAVPAANAGPFARTEPLDSDALGAVRAATQPSDTEGAGDMVIDHGNGTWTVTLQEDPTQRITVTQADLPKNIDMQNADALFMAIWQLGVMRYAEWNGLPTLTIPERWFRRFKRKILPSSFKPQPAPKSE